MYGGFPRMTSAECYLMTENVREQKHGEYLKYRERVFEEVIELTWARIYESCSKGRGQATISSTDFNVSSLRKADVETLWRKIINSLVEKGHGVSVKAKYHRGEVKERSYYQGNMAIGETINFSDDDIKLVSVQVRWHGDEVEEDILKMQNHLHDEDEYDERFIYV